MESKVNDRARSLYTATVASGLGVKQIFVLKLVQQHVLLHQLSPKGRDAIPLVTAVLTPVGNHCAL